MGIVLGGNCPGGNCIGGSYPGWEFSFVRVFRVGIVQWESSGGNFPGGAMFMLQVKNIFFKTFRRMPSSVNSVYYTSKIFFYYIVQ